MPVFKRPLKLMYPIIVSAEKDGKVPVFHWQNFLTTVKPPNKAVNMHRNIKMLK